MRRLICSRQVNRIVLCNGNVLRGRVGFRHPFTRHRAQYEVRVIRQWEPEGHDTYVLYHVDKEIADLLNLSDSLGISLAFAEWIFNRLSGISSTASFLAFARSHPHLELAGAVEFVRFISETEFELLNAC